MGLSSAGEKGPGERRGAGDSLRVAEVIPVDSVWAGLPVGFALLMHKGQQFVAYYDSQRQMTVAARNLGNDQWTRVKLAERVPWDSHNDITMAVDESDRLRLSGNMHGDSLNYYRTEKPLAIDTFRQLNRMIGEDEDRCPYPTFMKGADGGAPVAEHAEGL